MYMEPQLSELPHDLFTDAKEAPGALLMSAALYDTSSNFDFSSGEQVVANP